MAEKKRGQGTLCPSCGAFLQKGTVVCPYCGCENEELAVREEEEARKQLREDYQHRISALPALMTKKSTGRVLLALFTLAVLAGTVTAVSNSLKQKASVEKYDEKQEMLARLEELYQAGAYEEMKEAYYDSSWHGASFGKYSNTAEIWSLCKSALGSLQSCREHPEYCTAQELETALRRAFSALARIGKFRSDGFIYGEGDAVEELEKRVKTELLEQWGLSEDEISSAADRYEDRNTDYSDLAERLKSDLEERTAETSGENR